MKNVRKENGQILQVDRKIHNDNGLDRKGHIKVISTKVSRAIGF